MKVHVPQNIDSEVLHSVYLQLAANNLSVCNTFWGSTPPPRPFKELVRTDCKYIIGYINVCKLKFDKGLKPG